VHFLLVSGRQGGAVIREVERGDWERPYLVVSVICVCVARARVSLLIPIKESVSFVLGVYWTMYGQ
jgi:hypothetical protein